MKSDSEETPFDSQMSNDLQSRRAEPTHVPVRIGASASPTDSSSEAPIPVAPVTITSPVLSDPPLAPSKERVPTPVLIGLAMALGAVCVVGASIGMRRVIKPLDPVYPTGTALPPQGNVVMPDPEVVIKNPQTTEPATPTTAPGDGVLSDSTSSVEISELPPITAPAASKPLRTSKPASDSSSADSPSPETAAPADTYPPADTHQGNSFEITPPPGFRLRQSGRRTIWQRDDGAQILVETGKAGDGSPRAGWQKLDRDLTRRYGDRYHSFGIHNGTLAGQPAAIWEFELTGKDGVTRRKMDVGIKINGRGYAVLGAAPSEKFDQVRGEIEQALGSFRVSAPAPSQPREREDSVPDTPAPRPRVRPVPTLATEPDSPLPQPENKPEVEKGY